LKDKNTLYVRQNEEKALIMQATSRLLCDRADNFDLFNWGSILFLAGGGVLFPHVAWITFAQIIWFFISIFIENVIQKSTVLAAKYKEDFDNYVFGWTKEIASSDYIDANELLSTKPAWKKEQIENTGLDRVNGVKDWYDVRRDEDQLTAVNSAMRENVFWDLRINTPLWIIMIILIVTFIVIGFLENTSFVQWISIAFITFAGPSKKVIMTLLHLHTVSKINNEIKVCLNVSNNMDNLRSCQKLFFMKRQISGVSNRYLYIANKKKLNKIHQEL